MESGVSQWDSLKEKHADTSLLQRWEALVDALARKYDGLSEQTHGLLRSSFWEHMRAVGREGYTAIDMVIFGPLADCSENERASGLLEQRERAESREKEREQRAERKRESRHSPT